MSERCFSCGDLILRGPCKIKGCRCPEDPRCRACHMEIHHGAIPDVTGDGVLGGNQNPEPKWPSPWQENNIRYMEDGQ